MNEHKVKRLQVAFLRDWMDPQQVRPSILHHFEKVRVELSLSRRSSSSVLVGARALHVIEAGQLMQGSFDQDVISVSSSAAETYHSEEASSHRGRLMTGSFSQQKAAAMVEWAAQSPPWSPSSSLR